MHRGSRRLGADAGSIGLLGLLRAGHLRGPHPLVNRPTDAPQTARFRACQRERPRPLQAAATGPCGDWGRVSQRASASTRTVLAAAALAEPLGEALPDGRAGLLGNLQQEGPERLAEDLQEVSREQPPQGSSPHAGAETDQRYRLQRWNRGNEKRLACARRPRVGGPIWAHSDDYSPTLSIGQAIGQVSWSTAVGLSAVAAASGQSGHRRSPPASRLRLAASISASRSSRRWARVTATPMRPARGRGGW
jgi:hypothetical protein